jgi:hypothetical protein
LVPIARFRPKTFFVVGGFEAFVAVYEMYQERKNYDAFKIPMVLLPATVSNNSKRHFPYHPAVIDFFKFREVNTQSARTPVLMPW